MKLVDYLVSQGYQVERAQKLIQAGQVYVNHQVEIWPGQAVKSSDKINVKLRPRWVSRGAEKLIGALAVWKLDFQAKNVLDIGASTGGFAQVALAQGAQRVWALDVGTNQLDYSIRQDPRVVVMEKKNAKNLDPSWFDMSIDIVTCDLSFISLTSVLGAIRAVLKSGATLIALVKPQFEARREAVEPGGFVPADRHPAILDKVLISAQKHGFKLRDLLPSGLPGKKAGNTEYFAWWESN